MSILGNCIGYLNCFNVKIIDMSEPLIMSGVMCGCVGIVYGIITGGVGITVIGGIVTVSGLVAEWRVRALGIAKKLMDSLDEMKKENEKLRGDIIKFEEEIENFKGIVGLLGDNVDDIEGIKVELFDLYKKYKKENDKCMSNNLLTLFGLIDKDDDSILDLVEMGKMKEYIKIVYGEDIDFNKLDVDMDGGVSLKEFFEKFRKTHMEGNV